MTDIMSLPDFDGHEAVHFFHDKATGLDVIVALHNTYLGPGAGGTRFWHYPDPQLAVTDALRLSRGMSYKNAMAGLPWGGGKAVILADKQKTKSDALFAAFGRMIESLNGQYITAEDVGMTTDDMALIAQHTSYVSGLPAGPGSAGGDPGPYTAMGVYLGIKAAAAYKLGRASLEDVHIAIQGVGSVGGGVARLLAQDGARLTLADIDAAKVNAMAAELDAQTIGFGDILSIEADILSPNALGGIFDENSIDALNVSVIAGGANNQLMQAEDGQKIFDRGILFTPDYVINAGGIINVCAEYNGLGDAEHVRAEIAKIPDRLNDIWSASEDQGRASSDVADDMARQLIDGKSS